MTALADVRWSHVGLNCRDQTETEEFYRRWFGFRRVRVVEDGGVRVVFLRQAEACLELFTADNAPAASPEKPADPDAGARGDGHPQPGIVRHIAFQVDDLDEFLVRAAGQLTISLGPLTFDRFIPGWKTVWVIDPDGVVVEVSQGYTDQLPGGEHDA
jgi:glyoxylase I family protein